MQKGEEQATHKSDLCPFNLRSENLSVSQSYRRMRKAGGIPKAEDNRIFLSTSLTMSPTRFSDSPPPPGMAGDSLCGRGTGGWPHALEAGALGCPHTKGSKGQAHQLSVTHRKVFETVLLQRGKRFTAVTFAVQTPTRTLGTLCALD